MKVKDLIRQLTEFDMEKEVRISVDYEHEDVIGGKCKGYSFPIERIELFAGGVDILFPADMVDHIAKASTIKNLKELKEEIIEEHNHKLSDDNAGLERVIWDFIDPRIEELEGNECDNDNDCEHCDWVECPVRRDKK